MDEGRKGYKTGHSGGKEKMVSRIDCEIQISRILNLRKD